jgi:hypothetical protein
LGSSYVLYALRRLQSDAKLQFLHYQCSASLCCDVSQYVATVQPGITICKVRPQFRPFSVWAVRWEALNMRGCLCLRSISDLHDSPLCRVFQAPLCQPAGGGVYHVKLESGSGVICSPAGTICMMRDSVYEYCEHKVDFIC